MNTRIQNTRIIILKHACFNIIILNFEKKLPTNINPGNEGTTDVILLSIFTKVLKKKINSYIY